MRSVQMRKRTSSAKYKNERDDALERETKEAGRRLLCRTAAVVAARLDGPFGLSFAFIIHRWMLTAA